MAQSWKGFGRFISPHALAGRSDISGVETPCVYNEVFDRKPTSGPYLPPEY
jgi:hypothetical protein